MRRILFKIKYFIFYTCQLTTDMRVGISLETSDNILSSSCLLTASNKVFVLILVSVLNTYTIEKCRKKI